MTDIPARQPYGEVFTGAIMTVGSQHVIAPAPLPDAQVLHRGSFVLRYGVEYLGKPQYSIVPGLIAIDYGEMFVGEEAWDFLLHRSNLYPRGDVLGYRNDGEDDMITIKRLDLVPPFHILAYPDEQATTPLARIAAVIASDETHLPPWLARYARRYPSLTEYQAQNP
jgi:hypothetical protein